MRTRKWKKIAKQMFQDAVVMQVLMNEKKQEQKEEREMKLKVSEIVVDETNARNMQKAKPKTEASATWASFMESIKNAGILVPLIVQKTDNKYVLIAGHRRLAAAKELKLEEVPVDIKTVSIEQAAEIRVIENLQREDLTFLEESKQVAEMLRTASPEDAALKLGKDIFWIRQRARIQDLAPSILKTQENPNAEHPWGITSLMLLTGFPQAVQEEIYGRFKWRAPTVKDVKEACNDAMHQLSQAPFDREESKTIPCSKCPKRSGVTPELFNKEEISTKNDSCLDHDCWTGKIMAYVAKTAVQSAREGKPTILITSRYTNEKLEVGGTPVLVQGDYDNAPKNAKNAIEALSVDTGRKVMITLRRELSAKASKVDSEGKKIAKPMKEKVAALNLRRAFSVLEKLRELLTKSVRDSKRHGSEVLLPLVARYGTGDIGYNDNATRKKVGVPISEIKLADAQDVVWIRLKHVLDRAMKTTGGSHVTGDNTYAGKLVAELLDLKWDDLMAQAAKDLPEPKSWSKK